MKRFRIAYLVSHPIQYQVPLLRRMAEHPQIALHVYYMEHPGVRYDPEFGQPVRWDIPLLEGYPWSTLRNYSPFPSSSGFLRFVHPGIFRILMRRQFDAVIVHGYAHLTEWIAFIGAWLSHTPLFLRGESTLHSARPLWVRIVKSVVLKYLLRRVTAVLAIGTLNREFYRFYGVPEDKIFFVPYAVDNDRFFSEAARLTNAANDLRDELGWPRWLPIVLYAGKLVPRKRPLDLLEAYARVVRDTPAGLMYLGDGQERQRLISAAEARGLKWVAVTGFVNQTQIPRYYAAADVLVLPSDHEPWGLVLNEGMCFGLPVIVSDRVGAAPDLVRSGENGFVYPVGDVATLARVLKIVLGDRQLRARMGRLSREIIGRYSFQTDLEGVCEALHFLRENRAELRSSEMSGRPSENEGDA